MSFPVLVLFEIISALTLSQPEKEEFGDVIRLLKRDLTVTSEVAIFRFTLSMTFWISLDYMYLKFYYASGANSLKLVIVYMREDIPDEYRK